MFVLKVAPDSFSEKLLSLLVDFTTGSSTYLRALCLSALCSLLHNCQKVGSIFCLLLWTGISSLFFANFLIGLLQSSFPFGFCLQAKVSLKKTGIVNKLDEIKLLPG